jgi:hypothetical protein
MTGIVVALRRAPDCRRQGAPASDEASEMGSEL